MSQTDHHGADAAGRFTSRFMGIEIAFPPDVLAPSAETERLGRTAIDILGGRPGRRRVIDMCCGSAASSGPSRRRPNPLGSGPAT